MATRVAGAVCLTIVPARPEHAHADAPFDRRASPGDAAPSDAARATVALWLFVLLIYLPKIVQAHSGEGIVSIALDSATILVSMLFAAPIFLLFRATLGWSLGARTVVLGGAILLTAASQAVFDLVWTGFVADNLEKSWRAMSRDLTRGYGAMLNYISVFAVNFALFQLAYTRRRGQRQERQLAAMHAAGQQADLEALRFKFNPHFLFNTLNGISAMIVTRRLNEADEMIDRLASYLRASFKDEAGARVTVEHELAQIEHYLRIEELRFGARPQVELVCAGNACDLTLPPLLVQQLVEQAIEAAAQAEIPAEVAVIASVENDALSVTIAHPQIRMPARHVATARARIAALDGACLTGGDGETRLWLPARMVQEDSIWEI